MAKVFTIDPVDFYEGTRVPPPFYLIYVKCWNITTGPLPQHLLGDMWGRFWSNLYSIAVPYPDEPSLDVTPAMVQQNYTILKMFQTGEQFYTSMGLLPLPSTFYSRSMLERPTDREVVCHATAWDFFDGKDFRQVNKKINCCMKNPPEISIKVAVLLLSMIFSFYSASFFAT